MPAPLLALSPLDGRYAGAVAPLRAHFSEAALVRERVRVELTWLAALAAEPAIPELRLSRRARARLARLAEAFSPADAARVKAIEARTRHDVKAVEYFLRERLGGERELRRALEFVHFACTSEDINNLAYGRMLLAARAQVLLPALDALVAALREAAHRWARLPMLARTHGQPASPTTLGKECANFAARLKRARAAFAQTPIDGKLNGAVGNWNAHAIAYPEVRWERLARRVVAALGLRFNAYTTQIEPHDGLAALLDACARVNAIVLDVDRDCWGYVALGYFRQRRRSGEVGSSTMPHKVNPIDFENSEGNAGVANALLRHLADKLPVSRWQRDLSDSTVLRNVGVAFGHSLLAWDGCRRGLARLEADRATIARDLEGHWEVLGEALQQVARRYGVAGAYERVAEATRGRRLDRTAYLALVRSLGLPPPAERRLSALAPARYTGYAARLARRI